MVFDSKMKSSHDEMHPDHGLEKGQQDEHLDRIATVDVDNYHGIDLKTVLVYIAVCLQYFVQLYIIAGTGAFSRNVGVALGNTTDAVWIPQVTVIAAVVLGPPGSQAADFFGRKWFLIVSGAFGCVGAIITATAHSMGQAIAGATIASVLYLAQPILIAVGSEILPRKFRPIAQAGLNATGALGAIVCLLAGSALTANNPNGWRYIFYIGAALTGASAIIIVFLYNPPPRPLQTSLTLNEKLARLDWVGSTLLTMGLVLFVMGLSWAYNPYPWTDAHVLAPLIIGGVLFIVLVIHQTWFKKDGLLHHDMFKKDRNFAIALGCFFADGMIFWAANSYFAFQVSVLYETDPMLTILHFCVAFFAAVGAAATVVLLTAFTKIVREPIVVSFVMFLIFNVLMATAKLSSASAMWGYPILLGIGLGWSLTYLTAVAQLSTPPHLIAITTGVLYAARSVGGAVALAIYTSIFNSKIASTLGANIAAAVLPLGFPPQQLEAFIGALAGHNDAALAQLPGVTPQIIGAGVHGLQTAYLTSFKGVWIAAAVFSGVTVIASCFLINPKRDLNNHVDAPLDE